MIKVLRCKSYEIALQQSKLLPSIVAVETEYGDNYFGVKDGAAVELLHHGKFNDEFPAATSFYKQGLHKRFDNFIVSHIDADTILGIMWAAGFLKPTKLVLNLSELIGEVDVKGFHWFMEFKYNNIPKVLQEKFLAIGSVISSWKFPEKNDYEDISRDVHKLILKIKDLILFPVPIEIIHRNKNFMEKKEIIKSNSMIKELSIPGVMVIYKGDTFLLDGYSVNSVNNDIVIHYNTGSNTINISCKDETIAKQYFGETGVIKPLQIFFGEEAGGRVTVGGSPRDKKLQIEYLEAFVSFIRREYLNI